MSFDIIKRSTSGRSSAKIIFVTVLEINRKQKDNNVFFVNREEVHRAVGRREALAAAHDDQLDADKGKKNAIKRPRILPVLFKNKELEIVRF